MLGRDDAVALIQEAYAARVRGDKEALTRYWAQDATFEIAGHRSLLPDIAQGGPNPMEAISGLIDQFRFDDLILLDAIVEGNRIAARWQVTVEKADLDPETTQLVDLIELDEDGKIRSFVQFCDTALIRHMTR